MIIIDIVVAGYEPIHSGRRTCRMQPARLASLWWRTCGAVTASVASSPLCRALAVLLRILVIAIFCVIAITLNCFSFLGPRPAVDAVPNQGTYCNGEPHHYLAAVDPETVECNCSNY
ncbi:hypothetical protein HPB52_025455 [Rhipicephalus sanguineus]|uniref:Uncharacterized protein n=1 Tax=Rhipicephalus sanguineus TaxID=34632 RepID=A0A9D4TD14_RHISA|nr:hypothetical protein HPB52_025455 [Rhipicephalus sanguineus]